MTKTEAIKLIAESLDKTDRDEFTDEDITYLAQRITAECRPEDIVDIYLMIDKAINEFQIACDE